MTARAKCLTVSLARTSETAAVLARLAEPDSRTLALLSGSIAPTLLSLAWPNILVMLAQSSTGLIETWRNLRNCG